MGNKKTLITLAGARLAGGNLGCQALALSALSLLQTAADECGKELDIYLPHSGIDVRSGDGIPQEFHGYRFLASRPFFTTNSRYNLKLLALSLCGRSRVLKNLRDSQYVFSLCEGDSFSDIYGIRRFEATDMVHRFSRLLGRPLVMLPQTLGPFSTPAVAKAAARTLHGCREIMVRDSASLSLAGRLCPEVPSSEYPDLAFALPFRRTSFDDTMVHVGFNVSGLLYNGGYTGDNQFGLKEDYAGLVEEAVAFLLGQKDVKVHLIAHVFAPGSPDDDEAACLKVLARFKGQNIVYAGRFADAIEAKSCISGMDFFAGSRMHSVIAAFSSQVPCLPLSYSPKFTGLFTSSLHYPFVADLAGQDRPEILETLRNAFESRASARASIQGIIHDSVEPGLEALKNELIRLLYDSEA